VGERIFAGGAEACRQAVEQVNQRLAIDDRDRGLPAVAHYLAKGSRAVLSVSAKSLSRQVLLTIAEIFTELNQTAHLASISYKAHCAGRLAVRVSGAGGDSPKGFALLDRQIIWQRRVAAVSLLLHDSPCPSHLMPRSPVCLGATPPLTLPLPDSSGLRAGYAMHGLDGWLLSDDGPPLPLQWGVHVPPSGVIPHKALPPAAHRLQQGHRMERRGAVRQAGRR
jgi:hypothetical protein